MLADMRCGADFVRSHNLPVIDEEHRDLGGVENLADLRSVRAMLPSRKAACADLANTMGFVADQHVYFVVLGAAVTVEVLERCPRAGTDDLPQRLGEGLGAGGAVGIASLAHELRHQVDRKHGLSC